MKYKVEYDSSTKNCIEDMAQCLSQVGINIVSAEGSMDSYDGDITIKDDKGKSIRITYHYSDNPFDQHTYFNINGKDYKKEMEDVNIFDPEFRLLIIKNLI